MSKLVPAQKSDYFTAILSAIAFAGAFPPSPLDWLAWFSLAPFFKLMERRSVLTGLRLGWTWGIAHFVALVYWIVVAIGHYGGMPLPASIAIMGLLVFYLALYPAIFCVILTSFNRMAFSYLWVPCTWVALEYGRAKLLTGFPWCLAGYSLHANLHLIQVARLFGVYGLSFLIILVNWSIYKALLAQKRDSVGRLAGGSAFVLLCILASLCFGHYQLQRYGKVAMEKKETIKVAVIQPSIDQSVKWDPAFQSTTMDLYENLTKKAAESKPDLVIWPETATPFFFQTQSELSRRVYELIKQVNCPILFGSPAYKETPRGTIYFNRAYLVQPDGGPIQYYDKVHLVPFGEYVPLGKLLSFIGKLVPGAGSFSPGSSLRLLKLNRTRFGVLICFEAIFPEISRQEKKMGANFFANLTNDAWFGKTSAPYQHLAMSVFRAVENGAPLVRAANTGISAIIEPSGRVEKTSSLFKKQVLVGRIVPGGYGHRTFYTRHGDLFAQCTVVVLVMVGAAGIIWRQRSRK